MRFLWSFLVISFAIIFMSCNKTNSNDFVNKRIAFLKDANGRKLEQIKYTCSDTSDFGLFEAKKVHFLVNEIISNFGNDDYTSAMLDSLSVFYSRHCDPDLDIDFSMYSELLNNNTFSPNEKELELLSLENNILTIINDRQISAKLCFDLIKAILLENDIPQHASRGDVIIIVSNKEKSIKGSVGNDSLIYAVDNDNILKLKNPEEIFIDSIKGVIQIPICGQNGYHSFPIF